MAVATPTLFRFDIEEETDDDRRFADTARDQYHDSHISERFRQIMDPNKRMEDLCEPAPAAEAEDMATAPVQPVQEAEEAPAQQVYSSPQQPFMAGPQLVQDARVTSDLFRAKDTYKDTYTDAAPAAPVQDAFDYSTAEFEVIGQSSSVEDAPKGMYEEEENEDLVPTMTTRQYGSAQKMQAGQIENIGAAKKSSIVLSKRDKILMFSIIGIVALLFVLIIVNAAIISGLNSQVSEVEQEYNAVYNEYMQVDGQVQSAFADLEAGMDQYAADFGMAK